jgi:predicted transcriptional regulator of viral defense system
MAVATSRVFFYNVHVSTVLKNTSGKRMARLVATGEKLFHLSDLALLFGIENPNTLRVTLNRYTREGLLYRIRRGLYGLVPPERIDPVRLAAALLHQYCYLSTETILWESGIILQTPQAITFVSADARRFSIHGHRIVSRQLQDRFLHHPAGIFTRDGVRRATVERAVCDLLYFQPAYHFDHPIDWTTIRSLQQEIGYSLTPSRYADTAPH